MWSSRRASLPTLTMGRRRGIVGTDDFSFISGGGDFTGTMNTVQARFNNGSGFASSVELTDDLAGANYEATIEAYLSAGADYGLSLWVNNWTDLKTNISDAGSFASSASAKDTI